MTDKLTQFPVKCKQCNREIPEGTVYYSHPKLGFVCEFCTGFNDGRIKANEDGTLTDSHLLSDQEISDALELCESENRTSYKSVSPDLKFEVMACNSISRALKEIQELRKDVETERMRLAACGVAALGYFHGCHDDYNSASLNDVLNLRARAEKAQADSEKLVGEREGMKKEIIKILRYLLFLATCAVATFVVKKIGVSEENFHEVFSSVLLAAVTFKVVNVDA